MRKDIWELRKGDTVLGALTLKEQDMFWFTCNFEPTAAFEPYRDIFAHQAHLLDTEHGMDSFDALYAQIGELSLSLHINDMFDDKNVYLLHILEDQAWFRMTESPRMGGWVDKPFEVDE